MTICTNVCVSYGALLVVSQEDSLGDVPFESAVLTKPSSAHGSCTWTGRPIPRVKFPVCHHCDGGDMLCKLWVLCALAIALAEGGMPRMNSSSSRRRRANVRVARGLRQLEHKMIGKWLRVSNDPPSTCSCPWNSVVVAAVLTGDTPGWSPFKTSQLKVALRSQVGLPVNHKVDIRVESFSVWNTSSIGQLDVTLDHWVAIQSFNPFTGTTLSVREDQGTAVRPAALKYVFPSSVFASPIKDDDDLVLFMMDVQKKFKGMLHFQILWKSSTIDPLPSGDLLQCQSLRPARSGPGPLLDIVSSFSELEVSSGSSSIK